MGVSICVSIFTRDISNYEFMISVVKREIRGFINVFKSTRKEDDLRVEGYM